MSMNTPRRPSQLNLFGASPETMSVTQVTRYVKSLLDGDYVLQDLWVEGEISNFKVSSSGHAYFTLKDEQASLRCVMWRPDVGRLAPQPQDGQAVLAHGYISVYEAGGAYQFYTDRIQLTGVGRLYLEFEALKQRLAQEGLFDAARKRALPALPRRLGVVTSPTAAALRDILNVLARRYPLVQVVLSPTLVQGDQAPPQIVAAIQALNEQADVDVIIVARGGGSLEELWAFNDEGVARAIAASRVPVVSCRWSRAWGTRWILPSPISSPTCARRRPRRPPSWSCPTGPNCRRSCAGSRCAWPGRSSGSWPGSDNRWSTRRTRCGATRLWDACKTFASR